MSNMQRAVQLSKRLSELQQRLGDVARGMEPARRDELAAVQNEMAGAVHAASALASALCSAHSRKRV